MKITCWNCQTTYSLKNASVDAALAAMDQAKVGFYDVHCPKCGKVNRTVRADFQKTEKPKARGGDGRKARPKVKDARTKKKVYKGR
jgi:phage FluMu protein Com